MTNFRLLSTKELLPPQKRRFIEWGCDLTAYNFIRIKPLNFSFSTLHEHLIFTSQNGVNAFFEPHPMQAQWKSKKVFCVGEKTKALLKAKGFTWIYMEENANALAEILLKQENNTKAFSFICGKRRRPEIENKLKEHNITVDCIETYTTELESKSFGPQDGILFFSPSGVESYLQKNKLGTAQCFALGPSTAAALAPHSSDIHTAKKPTLDHLGLCVHQYLNTN